MAAVDEAARSTEPRMRPHLRNSWIATLCEVLGWPTLAGMAALAVAHASGAERPGLMPLVYSALPYLLLPSLPLAALFNWLRRYRLAIPFGAVALYLLAVLTPATVTTPPTAPPGATRVRVLFANAWEINPRTPDAVEAVLDQNADIVILAELHNRSIGEANLARLATQYPVDVTLKTEFNVWTRLAEPTIENFATGTRRGTKLTFVLDDGARLDVFVVHPAAPGFHDNTEWSDGLAAIREKLPKDATNTLVVGDFNTSPWTPQYGELLGRGYSDAHRALGQGLSTSWPVRGHRYPRFVRIDHALTSAGLTPTTISDVDVPGSDHAGFVIEVAVSR